VQNRSEFTELSERFLILDQAFHKQIEMGQLKDQKISLLEQQVAALKKILYGARNEKVDSLNSGQLHLEVGIDIPDTDTVPVIKTVVAGYTKTAQAKPVRTELPAHLRREDIILHPKGDITNGRIIRVETTEKLEIVLAEVYVKRYHRAIYKMPGKDAPIIADLPAFALPKAIAGESVLTHILISKYVDHLPLNRQIAIFKRNKIDLSDSTVNDWVKSGIDLLAILHDRLASKLLQSGYIQNDETPIKVLDSEKKGQTHRGYFWVSHSPQEKLVVFHYDKGRSAKFPTEFLKDYRGYLQTDGYGVYDNFRLQEGITLLGCMAHARRYFYEAQGNDKKRADYFIEQLQILYLLEQELRDAKADAQTIYERRQEIAVPVLTLLNQWLKDNILQVLPQSPIGKAIAYSLARWDKLMLYTSNGVLQIDNNLIENLIRPVAVGRKNYLFCGSHESAQRAAIIYSLFGTCKRNGINPQEWLLDVFKKLPARKAANIDDLLPQNWKPELHGVV
jgi:transposase